MRLEEAGWELLGYLEEDIQRDAAKPNRRGKIYTRAAFGVRGELNGRTGDRGAGVQSHFTLESGGRAVGCRGHWHRGAKKSGVLGVNLDHRGWRKDCKND